MPYCTLNHVVTKATTRLAIFQKVIAYRKITKNNCNTKKSS